MKTAQRHESLISRAAAVACVIAAGVVALFAFSSWCLGWWRHITFGVGHVLMDPCASFLMSLLSAAVVSLFLWPLSRMARRIGVYVGVVVGATCLLRLGDHFLEWPLALEHWLGGVGGTAGAGLLERRMEPLTALVFLVTTAAFLLQFPRFTRKVPPAMVGGTLSAVALLMSMTVILGYAFTIPLQYHDKAIPMSLLTAVSFVLLNMGLLLSGGASPWLPESLKDAVNSHLQKAAGSYKWQLLVMFVVLATAISLAGWFYLRHQQNQARKSAMKELRTIADLKIQQIVNWRAERLNDARFFYHALFFAREVQAFLAEPPSGQLQDEMVDLFTLLKAENRYSRIALFDSQLKPRLAVPPWRKSYSATMMEHAAAALRANDITIADLHLGGDGDIHIDVVFPVFPPGFREADGGRRLATDASPLAVVALELDPSVFLYPLIQSWPTPSKTAETLLVRREGDEVLFLNELRHYKGSAMTLRRPLSSPRLPAAIGLRGEEGVFEGIDYRGVPVVGAVRAVPDCPWILVAKIDKSEVYSSLYERTLTMGFIVAALLLTAALGVGFLWRQYDMERLRREMAVEQELRENREQSHITLQSVGDGVISVDKEGRVNLMNPVAERLTGWLEAEARGEPLAEVFVINDEVTRERIANPVEQALREDSAANLATLTLALLVSRDGREIPIAESVTLIRGTGNDRIDGAVLVFRDKTEERAGERELFVRDAAIRSSVNAVALADLNWNPTFVNDSFLKMGGYEGIGEFCSVVDLVADEERIAAVVAAMRRDGNWRGEVPVHRKNGAIRHAQLTTQFVTNEQGKKLCIMATYIDTTERKRMEEELRRSNTDLEQFAYVASHDLKSPLRGIESLAQWIVEDAGESLPAPSRRNLDLLQGRVRRMERMLDDLLAYSRAGRAEEELREVDVAEMIRLIKDTLHIPSSFVFDVSGQLPKFTTAAMPLSQVLSNLIDNAVKHHDRQAGVIRVAARNVGHFIEFTVEDDGPGIPPEFHERVFKMFQTLKPRDQVEGSGIGLALVKRIVNRYGGRVSIASREPRGTTFHFTWPRCVPAAYQTDGDYRI